MEDALKHSSSSSPSPEPLHANNSDNNNGMTRSTLMLIVADSAKHTLQTHVFQLKTVLGGEGSPAVTLN